MNTLAPSSLFLHTAGALCDVDMSSCPHCPAIFGNEETLAKHIQAIHPSSAEGTDAPSDPEPDQASSSAAKPEASAPEEEGGRNHLEVAPLLSVLTHEQKDMLLLRAIANDNALVYHVLAAVLKPLSTEAAMLRLRDLDASAVADTIHAYLEAGAGRNALAMLRVSTVALSDALRNLAALFGSGSAWEESEELEAVERLPAASTLGCLWTEALDASGTDEGTPVADCVTDEDEGLLLQLASSLPKVRAVQPALLLGPGGGMSASDIVDQVLRKLRTTFERRGGAEGTPPASKKARH
eukprot:scaffold255339_cov36-Tisochrysis_lutea.AAC.1